MLLIACVVVLVASAVQAATGFGFSLVAVPLLTLAFGPRLAVVATALPALLLASITVARDRTHVRWRTVGVLLTTLVVGMPIGLLLLRVLSERALSVVVALAVTSCAALAWRTPRLPRGFAPIAAAGLAAGVLATVAGPSGPPLIAAMQTMEYGPRELRGTLAAVFSLGGVLGVGGFVLTGALTDRAALVGAVAVPAVLLGWWIGNHLFERIDRVRFRRAVLVILIASCLLTVARAVSGN
ncbi:sulfite exporter TauE/SafE family protein [Planosporangium flavigriseum]|nr:sulfite exporter TauE/SafE family protein [Planosporangium flavigriseum]NJC64506.1 sulfite exporter TauE/SafE family protein [Planosporangium flavigriseum]